MFSLFQSIFSREKPSAGAYPKELVDQAIERAVDGTDRRIRAVSGYQKRLQPAILKTIEHVVGLVDAFAPPVPATPEGYSADPTLRAMFASSERMVEVMARCDALQKAIAAHPVADRLYCLLVTRISSRTQLGSDMVDGDVRQDVVQTVVNFSEHRLIEIEPDPEQAVRRLRRRAFDVLLIQLLEKINQLEKTRETLNSQHKLLTRKRELLKRAGWALESTNGEDHEALDRQLQEIETELGTLGATSETLEIHLKMVAEGLTSPADLLSITKDQVLLDRSNIQREPGDASGHPVPLQTLHDGRGYTAVVLRLEIDPRQIPKVDFLEAASKAFL